MNRQKLSRPHRRGASRPLVGITLAAVLAFLGAALATTSCASVGVSVGVRSGPLAVDLAFFHDELSPFGDWYWSAGWGWIWRPWGVGVGWVPYSHGRWIYTDFGWYWHSFWEWGWAPFHYGRWWCDPIYGWVWIPGRTWAPAWVAWRHRPGWIGWAPLAPEEGWDARAELDLRGREPDPAAWSFVRDVDLLDSRVGPRIEPRARNVTLMESTTPSVRFESRGRHAAERGLPPEVVERATGRAVERRRVEDAGRPEPRRQEEITRDAVRPYRPEVRATPAPPAPARTVEPPAPAARDRARLDAWAREEQRRLDRVQQQERRRPPAGVAADELARRQEAERRALRQEVERRQQWRAAEPPRAKPNPTPKPKPPKGKPPGGEGS